MSVPSTRARDPAIVLRSYGLAHCAVSPFGDGLINRTFLVEAPDRRRYVLQRVNPIFPRAIHTVIDAVTRHLDRRGLCTPLLVRSASGELSVQIDGEVWRVMTYVDGVAYPTLPGPAHAQQAGALLGRFHGALADFDWRYPAVRTGVHDLDRHLRNLRAAVERHRTHARAGAIVPLARDILAAAAALTRLPEFPPRVAHGDPKISNVIFGATDDNARCLVDLDTVGPLPWVLELGDAFRSWCNPAGEDGRAGRFDLDLFRAAVSGYAGEAGRRLDARERDRIVTATETIFVELAARFCADALEESYFGWDPARYPTRSEHNEVRAAGQLAAARALARVRRDADAIVAAAFAAPA